MADTIQQLLHSRSDDSAPAVKYGDRVWTWREHLSDASASAAALSGIADPTRPLHVGALLVNTPEMLTAMSGDLAYRDADGWIYFAGRSGDWLRVDGENRTTAPIERILQRLPAVSLVAVYAVPDEQVGDQVMAAVVLVDGAALTPAELGEFLAGQPDLSPKAWPRHVWITDALPTTATNKILKRELSARGRTPEGGLLWTRPGRARSYEVVERSGSAMVGGGNASARPRV